MLLSSGVASPAIGTVFWITLIFLLLLFLLQRFAWGPIMKAVRSREDTIRNALDSAEKAREERDKIIRDARTATERMLTEAKEKSQSEADAMVKRAKELIEREKNTAIAEVKREVASLAIEVASKVVSETLKSDDEQQKLISRYLKEIETTSN